MGCSAIPGRLFDEDRVQSAVGAVLAVVDVPDMFSKSQIRGNGWPGQSVDVSDLEFILHDSGNIRMGTVLLYHDPWSMVLHRRHAVVPRDLIPVLQPVTAQSEITTFVQ